jgi:LPXTG-motif cell wall-anchored protein
LWLDGNDLIPLDVAIYRLSNSTWTVLPTTLVKSEGERSYYTAVSPGLGRFAITSDPRKSAVTLVMGQETPQGTINDMVKASVTEAVPTTSRTPVAIQTTEVPELPATRPSSGFSSLTIVAAIFGILLLIGLVLVVRKRKTEL